MNLADLSRPIKNLRKFWLIVIFLGLLFPSAHAADSPPALKEYQPAPGEFDALGNAVAELLQNRDVAAFATNVTISADDLRAILATNLPAGNPDLETKFSNTVASEREKFATTAQALLDQADALHLDFSKGDWRPHVVVPTGFGSIHFDMQPAGQMLPSTEGLDVVFHPDGSTNNEFKIGLSILMKFPGGWRAYEGVHWASFPPTVGDEKMRRTMAILNKAAARQGLTGQDDPALLKLGEALIRFITAKNVAAYQKDAFQNADIMWAQQQKSDGTGPTREEFDEEISAPMQQQAAMALAMLSQLTEAGIDLTNADIQIKSAVIGQIQAQGAPGSLAGLAGGPFVLTLAVKSPAKAKTGVSLSGDYIIAADAVVRSDDDWRIVENIHWHAFPPGVLDPAAIEKIRDENYVIVNHALPPGMAAPDIDFITLDGGKQMKLSDLRGKVVVLDFWATWCGPCQGPMAELQTLRATHPDWKDRVAIVPMSIDDAPAIALKHVDQRGWTNTFNVWAPAGGFGSAPAKAFLVTAIPTTYIIDAQGKIAISGHPGGMDIPGTVDSLLKGQN